MLEKKLKEQAKKRKHAQIKYVKESENKEKIKNKVQKQENKENSNLRVPHIEYLKREEEKENFIEKLQEYLKMLKNVKLPKLERKNKIRNNKVEKKTKENNYNIKKDKYNLILSINPIIVGVCILMVGIMNNYLGIISILIIFLRLSLRSTRCKTKLGVRRALPCGLRRRTKAAGRRSPTRPIILTFPRILWCAIRAAFTAHPLRWQR